MKSSITFEKKNKKYAMKAVPLYPNKAPIKLKINLDDMPHSVYRKVLVPEDVNMMQMHYIVQIAMGWKFAHLFQFCDKKYEATTIASIPVEEDDFPYFGGRAKESKADQVKLKEDFELLYGRKPFWYWYDFGDDWWHRITFQKPTKKELELFAGIPVCVGAFGACPPEDVGGPWGYQGFLDTIQNKKHPEYAEMREWMGMSRSEKYDAEFVDLESINNFLSEFRSGQDWDIRADQYYD